MKYRVILKVRYNEAWFEFDTIEEAGEFAKNILIHQSENENCKQKSMVTIKVIDTTAEEEREEDD